MQKYTRFYVALAVVYTTSVVGLVYYIVSLVQKLLETSVLQSASLYSEAVANFRSIYTTEVVDIVDRYPDFSVTQAIKPGTFHSVAVAIEMVKKGRHRSSYN